MSKSPNFLIPALGGTALVLGAAFGLMNRDYAADKIDTLETRVEQVSAQASSAAETARAEAARATELEQKVAEIQAAAAKQVAGGTLAEPAPQIEGRYGLGRVAHAEEIAAWDVDILPDGRGLPEGSGDVWTGEEVFVDYCASCHGDFAEGVDNWPVLAGGFDTLADKDPVKTVGSYWPYLSTVWDYVHRSMPFGGAGTLTNDETYAIVAYILYSNDMVDDDFVLSRETFMDVEMHNAGGFIVDDRAEAEYTAWSAEPCMESCKDEVGNHHAIRFSCGNTTRGWIEFSHEPSIGRRVAILHGCGPVLHPRGCAKTCGCRNTRDNSRCCGQRWRHAA